MAREKMSIRDIMNATAEDMPEEKRAALPRDFVDYRPKLYKSLSLPSYVHGYSLAIEYMRSWFVSKFPKDYFKVIHVNGKHVLDDWKHFNNYNIRREKPMLAIVPTVDYDYDRDMLDTYLADQNVLLRKSDYQQSFIKDYKTMTFLYMQMRALKMNFTFKIRVNSRSEQLDLFNRMEIWFRIGSTQHQRTSVDFHIPYDIMVNIADKVGFTVEKCVDGTEKIADYDVMNFVKYLNAHSDLPIIYKMRAINQKPEFFVRVKDLYTHIACKDKIAIDDGDREGKLDTNFNLEMQCVLTIPIPHFYSYMSQEDIVHTIRVKDTPENSIGVYSINSFEIPPINDLDWGQVAVTSYIADKGETAIDLSSILNGKGNVCDVIRYSIKMGVSPASFIDVKAYHEEDREKIIKCSMNYNDFNLYFDEPLDQNDAIDIAIYGDKNAINSIINTLEENDKSRIKEIKND